MSLAQLPELVGFFSYAREDDSGSGNRLTRLRERIHEELRMQLGRRRRNFKLWQDKDAIAEGDDWSEKIKSAINQSVFFVPIITPTAIKSEQCQAEFEHFLAREKQLGRSDLVFPILYIRVPELEIEAQWRQHRILKMIGERQYLNWLHYRHLDFDSQEVGLEIERFCTSIHDALNRPPVSFEGAQKHAKEPPLVKNEEASKRLRKEDEQRQTAAEAHRRKRSACKQSMQKLNAERQNCRAREQQQTKR